MEGIFINKSAILFFVFVYQYIGTNYYININIIKNKIMCKKLKFYFKLFLIEFKLKCGFDSIVVSILLDFAVLLKSYTMLSG
jgi:hypothetical protein